MHTLFTGRSGGRIAYQFTGRSVGIVPDCGALLVENTLATGVLAGTARTLDRDHDAVRYLVPNVGAT